MTWLSKFRQKPKPKPSPWPPPPTPEKAAPLYAVYSPQRGYFAPGGVVWYTPRHSLAEAQRQTCEHSGPNYDWRIVTLKIAQRGVGPSEVKG